jgi:hypothetical protein
MRGGAEMRRREGGGGGELTPEAPSSKVSSLGEGILAGWWDYAMFDVGGNVVRLRGGRSVGNINRAHKKVSVSQNDADK